MIVFEKLTMQNFLSYGNNETELDLNKGKAILITGINYDASVNGEFDSNGCGKSTILNAISYVLYNKTISISEKLDELINNVNKKDMLVTLEFKVNKKKFRVSRFRKNKAMGGDGVLIEQKRGKTWKDITTTKPDPQIADDVLGIPFTIFNRIIGYAAGEEPFLKQGLAKQREVIDELFDYVELTRRADNLKAKLKGLKKDLEYAEDSNEEIKAEAKRHQEQLDNVQTRLVEWNSEHEKDIENVKGKIDKKSNIDFKKEKEVFDKIDNLNSELLSISQKKKDIRKDIEILKTETEKFNGFDAKTEKKIEKLKNALSELKDSEIDLENEKSMLEKRDDITAKVKDGNNEKDGLKSEKDTIESFLIKKRGELEHLSDNKCPYCLQQYEDAKTQIEKIEKDIKEKEKELKSISKKIDKKTEEVESLEHEKTDIEKDLKFDSLEDLTEYETTVTKVENDISELENSSNPYEDKSKEIKQKEKELKGLDKEFQTLTEQVEELQGESNFESNSELQRTEIELDNNKDKLKELENADNPYIEMLDELKKYEPKKNKDKEIENLRSDIKHCDFLIKLLTKKDSYLRKALMDKYLPLLNKRLHHYLTMMSLPHKVMFRSDLTTEISQFGQNIPYGNLSAGQKARINIALSLAFRDVLQAKHNFINLFVLDECLDVGLSNVGVKKTVKAIKEVASSNKLSMFVISHRDEARDSFPDKIEIELRNGFSTIKEKAS